jgi:hypothetical protein
VSIRNKKERDRFRISDFFTGGNGDNRDGFFSGKTLFPLIVPIEGNEVNGTRSREWIFYRR